MSAKIIETHISWVILTDKYAYKIKKPLDMGFLDYSSLVKRKHYCEEELRLGKMYAPELYLKVIAITVKNKIIDYALVMNAFAQENLFSNLLKNNKLKSEYFMSLADQLAEIHQHAAIAKDPFGSLENVFFPVQQNFDQIRPFLIEYKNKKLLDQLELCEKWANGEFKKLEEAFKARKKKHFIRECHGDLHLGNIVLFNHKPMMFDRIEFNDNLIYTDTMADVGFLLMDLDEKNQTQLGNIFLNQYLTQTGDYDGLFILRFYQAYRAVVRAKIKLMGPKIDWADYQLSINLAESYVEHKKPELFIMHGIAGSGKTTKAKKLAQKFNAIHLRSDVERKRIGQDKNKLYSEEVNQKTYEHLYELAKKLLSMGYSVIVDATFIKKSHRDLFRKLSLPFHIVPCEVDDKIRETWLRERQHDFSDADFEIAQQQRKTLEPLTPDERTYIYA
ncbi:MAG TPA: AAA family ATPase [Gammaproteobacteria bacterium]|nr:AAA family ATPase [Gammaproteobacteria bacterium]